MRISRSYIEAWLPCVTGLSPRCLPRYVSISSHILHDTESKQPLAVLVLLLSFCVVAFGTGADFAGCLENVKTNVNISLATGIWNSSSLGTVDTQGHATTDSDQITGLTYQSCVDNCGIAPVEFNWPTFSQEFTSWLLPWLALISQLPYGTRDTLSNFLAVLLTVGSPTLAAYSLALAVISNRWMVKRFGRSTYHNTWLAAQTLSSLQQVSLDLPPEEHVLPSLIVLPENGIWWQKLSHGLDYSVPKWTLASIMSVLYVALADSFTWISTLSGPLPSVVVNATGESISSLWLCFLPIVIGNLQLSPKSDWDRIRRAFNQANTSCYVATEDGLPEPGRGSLLINIRTASWDAIDEDELCSAPVFFYARAWTWIRLAGKVTDAFDAASQHERDHRTNGAPPTKRQDVINYCKNKDQTNVHRYEIYSIFLRSAFLAIFLQWGTTGAAIMAMFFTPTKGQLNGSALYPPILTSRRPWMPFGNLPALWNPLNRDLVPLRPIKFPCPQLQVIPEGDRHKPIRLGGFHWLPSYGQIIGCV